MSEPAHPFAAAPFPARIDERYDRVFAPQESGYLGADGALSVPLGGGRVFWLFGDTLLGRIEDGRRIVDGMPRNTVAIQDVSGGLPGRVTWHCNPSDRLRSFFELPGGDGRNWFWPGTGFVHEGALLLFGYRVAHGAGESEAMSFSVREPWLIRVSNPQDEPADWNAKGSGIDLGREGLWFSTAHVLDGGFAYLYGLCKSAETTFWSATSCLARVRLDSLAGDLEKKHFEFLCGAEGETHWSDATDDLHPVWSTASTEASVFFDAPRNRYVATAYHARSPEFGIATSPSVEGPWSAPAAVWEDPDHAGRDDLYSYAFRIHPHLAVGGDELVCTYAVNGRDFETLIGEPGLYYPRFVELDLRQVP